MINLKRLLEVQLIKEALPFSTAREYTSMKRNPSIVQRMDSIIDSIKQLPDTKTSKRGDRVYIPFETSEEPKSFDNQYLAQFSPEFMDFYNRLVKYAETTRWNDQAFSDKLGVTLNSYTVPPGLSLLSGSIYDKYGRQIKLSKFIQMIVTEVEVKYPLAVMKKYVPTVKKDGKEGYYTKVTDTFIPWDRTISDLKKKATEEIDWLIKLYNSTDEAKEAKNPKAKKKYYIVFSKHAYDVAGMSTNRGWTSCMNLYGGSNSHYVQSDVVAGTMVAYLVNETDLNINKPVARISIKPFVNINDPDDVFYQPEHRVYGTAPADFLPTVVNLIDEIQPDKSGTFQLIDTLYCDSNRYVTKAGAANLEEINALLIKQMPMRTVDEARYILQQYTSVYRDMEQGQQVKFDDEGGLFVSGDLDVHFNTPLTYCPVRFGVINTLIMSELKTFKNFPREIVDQLLLYDLRTPDLNFNGLFTKFTRLVIANSTINNFNGLPQGVSNVRVHHTPLRMSEVNSFDGLPSTVTVLNIHEGSKLNMTVQDMVRQLKPVSGLNNLMLPVREYATIHSPAGRTTFANSFVELMDSPQFDAVPAQEDSVNRRFWAILLAIANELKVKWINGTDVTTVKHIVPKFKIT